MSSPPEGISGQTQAPGPSGSLERALRGVTREACHPSPRARPASRSPGRRRRCPWFGLDAMLCASELRSEGRRCTTNSRQRLLLSRPSVTSSAIRLLMLPADRLIPHHQCDGLLASIPRPLGESCASAMIVVQPVEPLDPSPALRAHTTPPARQPERAGLGAGWRS